MHWPYESSMVKSIITCHLQVISKTQKSEKNVLIYKEDDFDTQADVILDSHF